MRQPRPRWCWILRHQAEEGPESQRVPGAAVQTAPTPGRSYARRRAYANRQKLDVMGGVAVCFVVIFSRIEARKYFLKITFHDDDTRCDYQIDAANPFKMIV